jgi:hypothetical protein
MWNVLQGCFKADAVWIQREDILGCFTTVFLLGMKQQPTSFIILQLSHLQ